MKNKFYKNYLTKFLALILILATLFIAPSTFTKQNIQNNNIHNYYNSSLNKDAKVIVDKDSKKRVGLAEITFSVNVETPETKKINTVSIFKNESGTTKNIVTKIISEDPKTNTSFIISLNSLSKHDYYYHYVIEVSYGDKEKSQANMPEFNIPEVEVEISTPVQMNKNTITMTMEVKTP